MKFTDTFLHNNTHKHWDLFHQQRTQNDTLSSFVSNIPTTYWLFTNSFFQKWRNVSLWYDMIVECSRLCGFRLITWIFFTKGIHRNKAKKQRIHFFVGHIAYLKLKSGDAQRTATLGTGGTRRIAMAIWFFHKRQNESLWLSDGVFLGGAELRNNEARLSLTGLTKKSDEFFDAKLTKRITHTLDQWHWIVSWHVDSKSAMLGRQPLDIAAIYDVFRGNQTDILTTDRMRLC